jgi:hypothetical protein
MRLDFVVERTEKTVEISFVDQIKITEYSNINKKQITAIGSLCKDCSLYQLTDVKEIYEIRLLNMIGQEQSMNYRDYDYMISRSKVEHMEGFTVTMKYLTQDDIVKEVMVKTYYTISSKRKSKPKTFNIKITNQETEYQNSFYKYKDMVRFVNKYRKDDHSVYINGMNATNLFLDEEKRSHQHCDCYIKTSINENGIFTVEYTENVFELVENAAA